MANAFADPGNVIERDESLNLDVSYVTKLNKVADARLQLYLTKITGKYELAVGRLEREMTETRNEVRRYKLAEDRLRAIHTNRGLKQDFNERKGNSTTDKNPTRNQFADTKRESLRSDEIFGKTIVSPSYLTSDVQGCEPICEKPRPHTVGAKVFTKSFQKRNLASRWSLGSQEKQKKSRVGKSIGFNNVAQSPYRDISMEPFFSGKDRRKRPSQRNCPCDINGESEDAERSKSNTENLEKRNSCLSRGHLPSTLNHISCQQRRNMKTIGEFCTRTSRESCRPMGTSFPSISRTNPLTRANGVHSAPVVYHT